VTRSGLSPGSAGATLIFETETGRAPASPSACANEDARAFEASGIGNSKVFDLAREGEKPDGTAIKLAFSLAFAADATSPNVQP
jgi:hypothetical protein